MAVTVDESKCTGCGICSEVCPVEAITVDQVAKIDAAICTDCGSCVAECPNEAISMNEMAASSSAWSSRSPSPTQIPAMRDKTLPIRPRPSAEQNDIKQVKTGLFRQFFNFFGKPTGQGHGQGRGRGKGHSPRRNRGRGRRNW